MFSKVFREDTKSLVQAYFAEYRTAALSAGLAEGSLSALDAEMQQLLTHAQKCTVKVKYGATLKRIRTTLDEFEIDMIRLAAVRPRDGAAPEARDGAILETLAKVCPSAAASYRQGLCDLRSHERLSWRGTATEFREALREVLDLLAPDDAVTSQPGFKAERDMSGPTMKQKTAFILKSRQVGSAGIDTAVRGVEVIEQKTGAFVRSVYTRASSSTHGHASRQEVGSIRDHVALILAELLEVPR
jgi:hypothetical protein